MGSAKNAMMEEHENQQAAIRYLVEEEVLSECPAHGYVGEGNMDMDNHFYARAVADFKRGVEGRVPWAAKMEQRQFTDYLKSAYDDNNGDCIGCANNERD